jgi:hypothetical protein
MMIRTVTLPFWRIIPYTKGKDPWNNNHYPYEPRGWLAIPIIVWPWMERDDILWEGLRIRDNMMDKHFKDYGIEQ